MTLIKKKVENTQEYMILVQTEDCSHFTQPRIEKALNSIISYIFDHKKEHLKNT